jgi:HAD superfamily hydrolase (TIGR01450 family)
MDDLQDITIEKLIDNYSVLLLDAYGVLVHTTGALPGAAELVADLNQSGKQYFILTNDASRLPTTTAKLFQSFGLKIDADRIITSGSLLTGYFDEHHLKKALCAVLGPEDSVQYVEKAGGQIVPPAEYFDVLVIGDESGYPFLETVDSVLTILFHKLDRKEHIHLVLPNPDLIYPKANHGFGIASGSIALMFEAALQLRYHNSHNYKFDRLGKPHNAIFAEAFRLCGTMDMIMIGDQFETDILGANAFGIDSALVNTGVTKLTREIIPEHLRPNYIVHSLISSNSS